MTGASKIQHVVLACDESGAKGYADRDEQVRGEVGVFAGIMVPGELLATAQAQFDAIAARYQTPPGKVHITDLTPAQQAQLRQEMFDLIIQLRAPCFFEAIHVAGFHVLFRRYAGLINLARLQHRSRIKLSLRGPTPDSLHVALFFGLYSKLLAFCMERGKNDLHFEMRTDQVDSPVFKEFQASANKLLNFGATVKKVTGFDPDTQKVLQGKVETAEVPPPHRLPITIHQLDFKRVTLPRELNRPAHVVGAFVHPTEPCGPSLSAATINLIRSRSHLGTGKWRVHRLQAERQRRSAPHLQPSAAERCEMADGKDGVGVLEMEQNQLALT
jgi:hypothetical protein